MKINIIKRDGTVVPYTSEKIISAISKANIEVDEDDRLTAREIKNIEEFIFLHASRRFKDNDPMHVEEIQDMVQSRIIHLDKAKLAETYITYRYKRALVRKANSTDESILSLIDLTNEEVMRENSNKAAQIASTQRDLMAGETSKDVTFRLLLPEDVASAHKAGILHFHDADYFIQHIHNCCLVNLEDMLQNGTVINGTMIEKPQSFATACNIGTQDMAVIASGQYGGQTVSLAHLAPFVDVSRQKIRKKVVEEVNYTLSSVSEMMPADKVEDIVNKIVEDRLRDEVRKGVQTIQYQVNTLCTSNGQTPFVSMFMYLGEVDDKQTKDDLAMIIEEVLLQRYQGVKNEKGVFITNTFPKLLYVLEEDNIHEDSKYYYLTELAAKCISKRMVPDLISEKIMKQLKIDKNGNGNCYPCINKICA